MALKKDGLAVDCVKCRYLGDEDGDEDVVNVRVPVADEPSGFSGVADVRCRITADGHEATLLDMSGAPEDASTRMQGVLDHLAEHRVCGNEKVCPDEVSALARRYPK